MPPVPFVFQTMTLQTRTMTSIPHGEAGLGVGLMERTMDVPNHHVPRGRGRQAETSAHFHGVSVHSPAYFKYTSTNSFKSVLLMA